MLSTAEGTNTSDVKQSPRDFLFRADLQCVHRVHAQFPILSKSETVFV